MQFFCDCKTWWTNPKRSRGLDTYLQSRWCLLKIPLRQDFCSHLLGTRKMERFEFIPLHCQPKSFITCLPTLILTQIIKTPNSVWIATVLAKPQRRSEAVKSPQTVVLMAFSLDRESWERIKPLRVTKEKKMQEAGFLEGCSFPLRDTPPIMPDACICTATSQQLAF